MQQSEKSFYDPHSRHLWIVGEFLSGTVTGVHSPAPEQASAYLELELLSGVPATMQINRRTFGRCVTERLGFFPVGSIHLVKVADFGVADGKVSPVVEMPMPCFELPLVRHGFVVDLVEENSKRAAIVELHPGMPSDSGLHSDESEVLGILEFGTRPHDGHFKIGQRLDVNVLGWTDGSDDMYQLELA